MNKKSFFAKAVLLWAFCAGIILTSCEWHFVDETVTVAFEDNTSSGEAVYRVSQQFPGGAWLTRWESGKGLPQTFKIDPGTYTFGLFALTTAEEVHHGNNGIFAKKENVVISKEGPNVITFTAEDLVTP